MSESPLDKVVRLSEAPFAVRSYQRRSAKGAIVTVNQHERSARPRNGAAPIPTNSKGRNILVQPHLSPIKGPAPAITVPQAKAQAKAIHRTAVAAEKRGATGVVKQKEAANKQITSNAIAAARLSAAEKKLAARKAAEATRKAAAAAKRAAAKKAAAQKKAQKQKQPKKAAATKPPAAAKAPKAPSLGGGGLGGLGGGFPNGGGGNSHPLVRSAAMALVRGRSKGKKDAPAKEKGAPSRRGIPTSREMRAARIAAHAAASFNHHESGKHALEVARRYAKIHAHGKHPLPPMFGDL